MPEACRPILVCSGGTYGEGFFLHLVLSMHFFRLPVPAMMTSIRSGSSPFWQVLFVFYDGKGDSDSLFLGVRNFVSSDSDCDASIFHACVL